LVSATPAASAATGQKPSPGKPVGVAATHGTKPQPVQPAQPGSRPPPVTAPPVTARPGADWGGRL
jgi:hypothetical protein